MPDKHVEAPSPGYGWIAAALALLLMMLSIMIGLYLAGFYEKHHDRAWASVLLLLITMLGCILAYWWHSLRLKQTGTAVKRRLTDHDSTQSTPTTQSPRTVLLARYGSSWRKKKAWLAELAPALATDDPPTTRQAWKETDHALFIRRWSDFSAQELRSLRGRWRLPLDGVLLLCGKAIPQMGDATMQALLDFNIRSGWRLPISLVLSGWDVPEGGVSCTLPTQAESGAIAQTLQQFSHQLCLDGQAALLRQEADAVARLSLSAALDQAGIIATLASQLSSLCQHLPTGQSVVRLGWVAQQTAPWPDHLAQNLRRYAPRRHKLTAADRLGWGLTGLALLLILGMSASFLHQRHSIVQAEQQVSVLQQARSVSMALPALAAVQQQIGLLEGETRHGLSWWPDLGLSQAWAVQQSLLTAYGRAARRWVLAPVQQNLRQVLLALNALPLSNGVDDALRLAQRQGYDSLKAYLMLDQPARAQPAFLAAQLIQADGAASGPRAGVLRFYSQQLAGQARWRLAAEPSVLEGARQSLLSLNDIEQGDDTIYQAILSQAAAKFPPRTAASLLPGVDSRGLFVLPGSLPGMYTREAWETFISEAFDKADPKQGGEASWVMGIAADQRDAAALKNRLRQRYFADYATAWQVFLNGLHWQSATSLSTAAEQLSVLADPQRSPLQALMTLLQYQGQAGAAEQSLAGHLLDKTRQLVGKAEPKPAVATGLAQGDPLARAFGPLLILAGAQEGQNAAASSAVSLARYLDAVTAVRLKLQQLAASPNPDAAARQLAQSLFRGQQNELSDGQKYAALLAASLGREWSGLAQQLFVSPLEGAGTVVMLPAAADINALWRRSLLLPWGGEMTGRYPFNTTDINASIPGLSRYLAPEQGLIARFLGNTLAGALVQEGDQWLPSPTLANSAPFDADFLNSVNALSRLASRLYIQGEAIYQFELMPVAMPGLVRTELSMDGQTLSYFNQQESWTALRWPGNSQQVGTRLVWESLKAGSRQTLDFSGRWAFIRLLEKARVEPLDKARYQLDFALPDGLTARYILRTSAGEGPLAMLKLLQFKLPERVFVVQGAQAMPGGAKTVAPAP